MKLSEMHNKPTTTGSIKRKLWKVEPVNAAGRADDASTPYGKLFKAGRLIYLWVKNPEGESYYGLGVLQYPKCIKPKTGDVIEFDDRKFYVVNFSSSKMSDVYCKTVEDKKIAKELRPQRKKPVYGPKRWKDYQGDSPRYNGVKRVSDMTEAEAKDELCDAMDLIREMKEYALGSILACEEKNY